MITEQELVAQGYSASHAQRFAAMLAAPPEPVFIPPASEPVAIPPASTGPGSVQVRAWAKRSGFTVSPHGPIPAHIMKRYEQWRGTPGRRAKGGSRE